MAKAEQAKAAKNAKENKEKKSVKRKAAKRESWFFSGPGRIIGPRLMLVAAVVILLVIGVVMIYSSSSITAYSDYDDPMFFFKRQLFWLAVGVVACVALSAVPYRLWSSLPVCITLWVLSVGMLVLLYVRGNDMLGATRSLTVGSFLIQPTEFAKVGILLLEASLLTRLRQGLMDPRVFLGSCAGSFLISLFLIYIQPDLGTAMILGVGFLILLFLGGVDYRVIIVLVGALALYFAAVCILQPYHIARIISTYNPWSDPLGDGYQTIQGFLALGSGGVFGTGLGLSRQKYLYLPYAYNDFIYAVIGEELGFIGAVVVLLLFALFIFAGLRIARTAPDIFGSMVVGSFTGMIGFQALLNMAMVAGLFPVTGKALPFISYGGSSLISTMIMVGIIISVSLRSKSGARYERRRDDLLVLEGGRRQGGQGETAQKPKKKRTEPAASAKSAKTRQAKGTKRQQGTRSGQQARSGGRGSSASASAKGARQASGRGNSKKSAASKSGGASSGGQRSGQRKGSDPELTGRISYSSARRGKSAKPSGSSPRR